MLNLSYNKLEGRVPESPHFMTFFNDSFLGIDGLRVPPLSKECNNTTLATVMAPHHSEKKSVDIMLFLFVEVGFGVGFAIAVVVVSWGFPTTKRSFFRRTGFIKKVKKAGSLVNYVSIS